MFRQPVWNDWDGNVVPKYTLNYAPIFIRSSHFAHVSFLSLRAFCTSTPALLISRSLFLASASVHRRIGDGGRVRRPCGPWVGDWEWEWELGGSALEG